MYLIYIRINAISLFNLILPIVRHCHVPYTRCELGDKFTGLHYGSNVSGSEFVLLLWSKDHGDLEVLADVGS
jgi:hypothetical protein